MIVVYIVLDEASEQLFARCPTALAPPVYRRRLEAMASGAARARTMAGLWLFRQGLAMLGLPAEGVDRLGFGPGGRPELAGGPFFSISHSARLVACAVSADGAVGLDVEQRRADVAPRLRRTIAPDSDFFASWCAREATVKASGRVGLARIRAVHMEHALARLDDRDWHLEWLSLASDYSACVAATRPVPPDAVRCIDCGDRLNRAHVE